MMTTSSKEAMNQAPAKISQSFIIGARAQECLGGEGSESHPISVELRIRSARDSSIPRDRARESERLEPARSSSKKILLANFHFSDFGTTIMRSRIIIFFLTSLFNDSIHSTSCNRRPLQIFHEEWKGE